MSKAASINTMKSTRAEQQEQRRQAIVDAAANVFLHAGFDNASMVEIAEMAGVSKQTLYSHFGSKEALFKEAINCACREHTPAEILSPSGLSLRETLTKMGCEFCELLFSEQAIRLESLCVAGSQAHPEVSQMFWEAGPVWIQQNFISYLQKQIDAGHCHADDAELAALQFIALLCGVKKTKMMIGIDTVSKAEIDQLVEQSVDFFLKAYGS